MKKTLLFLLTIVLLTSCGTDIPPISSSVVEIVEKEIVEEVAKRQDLDPNIKKLVHLHDEVEYNIYYDKTDGHLFVINHTKELLEMELLRMELLRMKGW